MTGSGAGAVAAYRAYVLRLLDQDAAFDEDATGEPPLVLADYRRALTAILALGASPLLLVEGRTVTAAEATAFNAGQQAGLDSALIAIGEAWRPALLRHRPVPARPPAHRHPPAVADSGPGGRADTE
ncbi:hypothetical protein MXD59_06680 [Frankia sp. Ag45/Mut15]|uniref:Uncharacterized protein n=1 Tax=Frankia umida TaxID=573489 RepID=A0ABT0JWT9_9ACTN|nr:hypothetical protein [Frankia umida]MCK9875463.1 hypothetical protein [Frankia umida]